MDSIEELLGEEPAPEPKGAKYRTPPYIAFKTLVNILGDFNAHGLPPVVDRSVLTRFAGGLQGQIMLALRSLGLIGESNRPTPRFAELVAAFETPAYKAELRKVIEATYPYVLALDLNTATPGMFANAFKDNLDAKEDVLRKCRTFFLNAAREVGIAIGPRIEKAKFPRGKGNSTRKPKPAKPTENPPAQDPPDPARQKDSGGILSQLLAKFPEFDPTWPDDIKAKWFDGFGTFMAGAKNNGG
jgi:hypothetical protein